MTKEEATTFFSELYYGEHHLPGKVREFGQGWCINHYGELATFDYDQLTRLVFMAHRDCCRVAVMSSGPRMVKIAIRKRQSRLGRIFDRHPTIENALSLFRAVVS